MSNQDYPRPALTVDLAVLRFHGGYLEILLIRRDRPPFEGAWALPGGFVDQDEPPPDAARRELLEETRLGVDEVHPLGAFGGPGRDPRGWVVSAAYLALAGEGAFAEAGDDAREVGWFKLKALPPLAFDHDQIIQAATARLRGLTQESTAPLAMLPPKFRTAQARHLYSQIWDRPLKPGQFKAWLRRREAAERVGPARFKRAATLRPDWWR
ncbi:NUDIX hydrolase [Myxococcota bacterium]|nr:NUDIX hydrolase [Myxococcota bacterium]MBU1433198.1 NUDIX hydrolase [Myxococcota bacterium]MBU1900487.1 NUDIX hydrolase [Myxococcota bacterium]